MKPKAYVGITGFKSPEDVERITKIALEEGFPTDKRTVMYGVLTSSARIQKHDRRGKRSPIFDNINEVTEAIPSWALPMIHYHTKTKEVMYDELSKVFDKVYDSCKAVQLNIDWPNLKQIEKLKDNYSELEVLLQLPKKATNDLSIKEIQSRVLDYGNVASYLLLDPSGGTGEDFKLDWAIEVLSSLKDVLPNTRIGVAGGLNGDNVYRKIKSIQDSLNYDILFDAEAGLMNKNNLCSEKVRCYLQEAKRLK